MVEDMGAQLLRAGVATEANLFYHFQQSKPDDALTLSQYGGPQPWYDMGSAGPVQSFPRLQVMARSANQLGARDLIYRAYRVLAALPTNVAMSDMQGTQTMYQRVYPLADPMQMGQDDTGRYVWIVNFQIEKEA